MQKKLKQRSKLTVSFLYIALSTLSISASPVSAQTSTGSNTNNWHCQANDKGRWVCSEPQDLTAGKRTEVPLLAANTTPGASPGEDPLAKTPENSDTATGNNPGKPAGAQAEEVVPETEQPAPATADSKQKNETQIRKAIVAQPKKGSPDERWNCKSDASGNWLCESAPPAPVIKGYEPAATPIIAPAATAGKKAEDKPVAAEQKSIRYTRLDWVEREHLSAEQLENVPSYCPGAYIEPEYVDPKLRDVDPTTQPLLASSVSSETTATGRSTLTGDVVVRQGYRQVKSDKAIIDRDTNIVEFEGSTEFREPDFLLIGDNAKMNIETREVDINNAEFVSHSKHMRGKAQQLRRDENGVFHVVRGKFTHCQPGSNIWILSGKKIELNQETGIGKAKHAVLRVKGVPVLYTPYIQFPIGDQRKSGLLFPSFGTSDDGFDTAIPYYFNIAPNYDATLTPRYISDRGVGAELEFRYLHTNNEGTLGGAYLPDDDAFNKEDRWLGTVMHDGTVFDNVNTLVDFTSVSDDDYFSDLGTDLSVSSQTHLLQLAEASYDHEFWDITTRVQGYQTIDEAIMDVDKPYDRLPQILLNAQYPFDNGIEVGISNEYVYFDRDNSMLTGLSRATGQRIHVEPAISWTVQWPYAYIKPEAKYKYTQYHLKELASTFDDTPSISVPVYSLDTGLFFERDSNLGDGMIQTFEPRLFYLNVPEEKGQGAIPNFDTSELTFSYNQLFRDDRFIGGDRVGDANQLSVGVTTRFINGTGVERFRFSAGQIFYFEDREVTLSGAPTAADMTSESAYAAEFLYAISPAWKLGGDIIWDPELSRTNESSINLGYRGDSDHIFNIGYRVRKDRDRIEQTDVSLIWPLSSQWSMFTRWNQDLIKNRIVEALAGVEYQNCCLSVRFAARRWINNTDPLAADGVSEKDAIYIQVQLKGLAGIGQSLEGVISNSIPGYEERVD